MILLLIFLLLQKKPRVGDKWRINFSRVEKKGDINWTWVPQIIWDSAQRKFVGKIAMHLPDAWGYVQFVDPLTDPKNENGDSIIGEINAEKNHEYRDPAWPAKITAMNVYYAQRQYKDLNQKYASSLDQLGDLVNSEIIRPFVAARNGEVVISTSNEGSEEGYSVKVVSPGSGWAVTVTNERLVRVFAPSDSLIRED